MSSLRIAIPVLVLAGLGVGAWLFLQDADNAKDASRAADALVGVADRALAAASAGGRFAAEEEENFVGVGAIFTSSVNVLATLVVKGTDGVSAVCKRMPHVRDYLVTVLSDNPPDPSAESLGPSGFRGSLVSGLNAVVETPSIVRVRFDPYRNGADDPETTCRGRVG